MEAMDNCNCQRSTDPQEDYVCPACDALDDQQRELDKMEAEMLSDCCGAVATFSCDEVSKTGVCARCGSSVSFSEEAQR